MKRLPVILVVVVSLSAVAFSTIWVWMPRDHIATPAEIKSYQAAACRAARGGLPPPPELYLGHGKWEKIACDINTA